MAMDAALSKSHCCIKDLDLEMTEAKTEESLAPADTVKASNDDETLEMFKRMAPVQV